MRCFIGWHKWDYFIANGNSGLEVVRVCSRCQDTQAWFAGRKRWSFTLECGDIVAQSIAKRILTSGVRKF